MQETNIDIEQTDFVEFSSENIHNNVFQAGFALDFIIEPFLRHFVAQHIKGSFDYSTLKLCSETHITPQLDVVMTDRMWSVLFKEQ